MTRSFGIASASPRIESLRVTTRQLARSIPTSSSPVAPLKLSPSDFAHVSQRDFEFIFREVFDDECYTRNTPLQDLLRPGCTVIDVGANYGAFTIWASQRVSPGGRVVSLEPLPRVYEALTANVANLAPSSSAVTPLNCAAASADGRATLRSFAEASGWSTLQPDEGEVLRMMLAYLEDPPEGDLERALPGPLVALYRALPRPLSRLLARGVVAWWLRRYEDIEVATRTLSSVMAELGIAHVDLLKIDVERAEVAVLRGIRAADWPRVRAVAAEVHASNLEAFVGALRGPGGFVAEGSVVVREDAALRGTGLYLVTARRDWS